MQKIINQVSKITAQSHAQSLKNEHVVELIGDVVLAIDDLARVSGDYASFDQENQQFYLRGNKQIPVSLETEYFFMLLDELFLDVVHQTGWGRNVRVHIDGRFIHAERAEKLDNHTWRLYDVIFTACDCSNPHWSFKAKEVELRKYFLRVSSPRAYVGSVPVLGLPFFIAPPFRHSKSGFLIPKFSIDKSFGIGLTIPYYFEIMPKTLDTTLGVHWRQKRGLALFNELRHTAHENSFSLINILYAQDRSKKKECPQASTRHRYWLEGSFLAPLSFEGVSLYNLFHIDFGTDKLIAYDFFNKPAQIEDSFWNVALVRWRDLYLQASLDIDRHKIERSRTSCTQQGHLPCYEKAVLKHLPRIALHRTFAAMQYFFDWRVDAFADRVFLREKRNEQVWEHDTFRFKGQAHVQKNMGLGGAQLLFELLPTMQVQSKLVDRLDHQGGGALQGPLPLEGGYRIFTQAMAQCSLPELVGRDKSGCFAHYIQPYITFCYIPCINQSGWLHADEHDPIYPQCSIIGTLSNRWQIEDFSADLVVEGGYDWHCPQDIFYLRRAGLNSHALPIKIAAGGSYKDCVALRLDQEFSGKNFSLLQLEMGFQINLPSWVAHVGWVHHGSGVQQTRCLLCDIPSFVQVSTMIDLGKGFVVNYSGNFALRGAHVSTFFRHVDVLLQQLRIDYNGHCWGLSFGIEEKRFSDQGKIKTEQVYCFSARLQSLGAFAKYFKNKPIILQAPHYE